MKKILILFVLISLITFTACNKQEMEKDIAPADQELMSLPANDIINNHGENAGKANFTINNKDKSLNEKDILLLTNKSVNAVSYYWDFGNGDTSTEAQPEYKYDIHGYYTVTLTITDEFDDTHQMSDEILVYCIFGGDREHDQ